MGYVSAPINAEVLNFFKVAQGLNVYEGYGQTETLGPATLTMPGDYTGAGYVGGAVSSMKIRLRDVPEMGYLSSD